MPIINGLEICSRVKALYEEKQSKLDETFIQNSDLSIKIVRVKIIRPMIVYMSDIDYEQMK